VTSSDTGAGKYSLYAIISHIGKNTEHGHYVCHILKDGNWILFNDEKVGKSIKPPLGHGFLYIYRRDDGPGHL
jgi:ubiquitin carboxyl-terminal hydrolase 5/13